MPSNNLDDYDVASATPGFDQRVAYFEQRMIKAYGKDHNDYNSNYIKCNKMVKDRIAKRGWMPLNGSRISKRPYKAARSTALAVTISRRICRCIR